MEKKRPIREIEEKWQAVWEKEGIYHARDRETRNVKHGTSDGSRPNFYGLIEFPYPSGDGLHVGHPRPYVAIDVVTRKHRMMGENVLYPIGWDAFGLPTENYAIKNTIKPQDATKKNIANFKRQIRMMGIGFDWSREIDTTDPKYYRWTQWQFLQFFNAWYDERANKARPIGTLPIPAGIKERGRAAVREYQDNHRMAYKAASTINWCPRCKIGLANEEAIGGTCERCGSPVEKRQKEQWMIRITKYAERLLNDLDTVDYLDKIKIQQKNWIGKSEGAYVDFRIGMKPPVSPLSGGSKSKASSDKGRVGGVSGRGAASDIVTVFTTRPDTIFGATYLVLAPEHPLVARWIEEDLVTNAKDVEKYRKTASKRTEQERAAEDKEKTGVVLDGIFAINPANQEKIPIWIADYVFGGYGTGAIMAVPAHDERDFTFAKKFGLPIRRVVAPFFSTTEGKDAVRDDKPTVRRRTAFALVKHWSEDKYLCLDWEKFGWHSGVIGGMEDGEGPIEAAKREIIEETGYQHPTFVKYAGEAMHTSFFAAHKDVNRYADGVGMYFVLQDETWKEPNKEETKNHKAVWIEGSAMKTFLNLPNFQYMWEVLQKGEECFTGDGVMINSGSFTDQRSMDAKKKIIGWMEKNKTGERAVTYKLRDWVFSRQRYWGEPIPMVICGTCGFVPVPDDQLPVELPDVAAYEPTDTGESPLAKIESWVNVNCPHCGEKAKRETDTMPNWAGSSWYFIRYTDPHNDHALASKEKMQAWLPVDLYNGGMEHTTLHLLYSRFWYKFLFDRGIVPKECGGEPYRVRRSHGLVMAPDGTKMSKSKGNVINPDDIIEDYGADVFRVYELFMGPFDQAVPWDTNGIEGVRKFLDKVWTVCRPREDGDLERDSSPEASAPLEHRLRGNDNAELETLYHQTVKKITDGIDQLQLNTCVSALMILTNAFHEAGGIPDVFRDGFLKMLAPFAPHLAEELWHEIGYKDSIHLSRWPAYDAKKLQSATFELVVQINGKVRDRMMVDANISEAAAKEKALSSETVQKRLAGQKPKNIIYVKGKIISIVL